MKFYHALILQNQVNCQLKECVYDIQRNGYTSTYRLTKFYIQLSPQKRLSDLRERNYPMIQVTERTENKFGRWVSFNLYTFKFLDFIDKKCIFEGMEFEIVGKNVLLDGRIRKTVEEERDAIFWANAIAVKTYFDNQIISLRKLSKAYSNVV